MSEKNFTQIKNELIRSTKLTPKERSVLFVLISYSAYEEIFIGQKKLADQSGMKRKSVIEALKGLRKKKLITTEIKADRSTLVYKLSKKLVVSKTDNVVSKLDKGCVKTGQGVVSKRDTNNKDINNKELDKKKKEKESLLASQVVALFNQIKANGKEHDIHNETHLKKFNTIIKALKKKGFDSDEKVLAEFEKVFKNKKTQHDDPDCFWNHFKISVLSRKDNFLSYMDEDDHKSLFDRQLKIMEEAEKDD